MRICLISLRWLLVSILLLVAINLKDPHLLPIRSYESSLLILFAVLAIVSFLPEKNGLSKNVGLLLLTTVMVLTIYEEFSLDFRKKSVLDMDDNRGKQLGEHFIVGYEKIEELKPLVSKGLIAGIFITKRNAEGQSTENLRKQIEELQTLRKAAGLPMLLIATDQEGGSVSRLSPPLVKQDSLGSLVTDGATLAQLRSKAENYGEIQGAALAGIGVNVNFSPVVDLKSDRKQSSLDFHSQINQRAISSDPIVTTEMGKAYVQGLASQYVIATLKHFPGLGRVENDTHHFSATLNANSAELSATDWVPFKQIAKDSDAFIMLSHVVLNQVDADNPVSFSKKVALGLIREDWGHAGVLITDDLTMAAAYNRGFCEAVVKSLNASVDLLLVSYDYEKFFDAMYCAKRAYDDNLLDKNLLTSSHERLQQVIVRLTQPHRLPEFHADQ